ncbi:MAG: rhodanese-like domain-containing protein [Deltaproteobacteria bacterium]|nr:rhodanese-like domain-containing protein [Deltaproteobacteria bacterium]
MKIKLLLLLSLLLLPAAVQAKIIDIDNTQLQKLLAQQVPLVDVRTAPEWTETGVIKGSHLLTFFAADGSYDARAWLAELAPIAGKNDPLILICRTGHRSGVVSKFLDQQVGYKTIYNVRKGILSWLDKGNPTVAP